MCEETVWKTVPIVENYLKSNLFLGEQKRNLNGENREIPFGVFV